VKVEVPVVGDLGLTGEREVRVGACQIFCVREDRLSLLLLNMLADV
jgi:hypothetical protein